MAAGGQPGDAGGTGRGPVPGIIEASAAYVEALREGDGAVIAQACEVVVAACRVARAQDLTTGAHLLAGAVGQLPAGRASAAAPLLGSLVQAGADPGTLDALVERAAEQLELAARFIDVWQSTPAEGAGPDGGEALAELPEPVQSDASLESVRARLRELAPVHGLALEETDRLGLAWLIVGRLVQGLLIPLQLKSVRQSLAQRDRLTAAAEAAQDAEDVPWLIGLLRTLDDEPLVVLHRASGKGYRLTMSGVGDNFQLHTLLAAALIGDPAQGLLAGTRPEPSWVLAATDGPLLPPGGISGQFNLVDSQGRWIWNEGRPADIPVLDGVRVVVLDPPPYSRGWDAGRPYPGMVPAMLLDEIMTGDAAAAWLARVAPAHSPFG